MGRNSGGKLGLVDAYPGEGIVIFIKLLGKENTNRKESLPSSDTKDTEHLSSPHTPRKGRLKKRKYGGKGLFSYSEKHFGGRYIANLSFNGLTRTDPKKREGCRGRAGQRSMD